ncbi:hypothetical protein VTK56DRAFT_438 [Thermocarpiscus australiensis]
MPCDWHVVAASAVGASPKRHMGRSRQEHKRIHCLFLRHSINQFLAHSRPSQLFVSEAKHFLSQFLHGLMLNPRDDATPLTWLTLLV